MIVNPWLFYAMNACGKVGGVALAMMIGLIIALAVELIPLFCCSDVGDDKGVKDTLYAMKLTAIGIAVFSAVYIVVPDKETLLMMQAAKIATTDNVNAVFEALKQAIDYTVSVLK